MTLHVPSYNHTTVIVLRAHWISRLKVQLFKVYRHLLWTKPTEKLWWTEKLFFADECIRHYDSPTLKKKFRYIWAYECLRLSFMRRFVRPGIIHVKRVRLRNMVKMWTFIFRIEKLFGNKTMMDLNYSEMFRLQYVAHFEAARTKVKGSDPVLTDYLLTGNQDIYDFNLWCIIMLFRNKDLLTLPENQFFGTFR